MAKKKGSKKKDGKKKKAGATPKVDKNLEYQNAINNAKIWAARVDIIEKSRSEYRDACNNLAANNENLQDVLQKTERDTIDVISFFKQADIKKDERIIELESTLRTYDDNLKNVKKSLIDDYEMKLREKSLESAGKDKEIQLLQKELLKVKEFRHKKSLMQEQIETIKQKMYHTTLEHENSIQTMERKFFDEKIKLEKEAGNRIAELAERAHQEAVKQLDITTRQVYQDNIQLTDALSKHIQENDAIRASNLHLQELSQNLTQELEVNEKTVKQKILESKYFKEKSTQQKNDIEVLQLAIEDRKKEGDREKHMALVAVSTTNQELVQHVKSLERTLELQKHEMRKIRRAANRVLKQRSEVEEFLVAAINHTRNEIKFNRESYVKAVEKDYQEQMKLAHKGLAPYPKITTFKKQLPHDKSTKSVYDNLNLAEEMEFQGPVDISDMTWEQREKVLRYLFAQINGITKKSPSSQTSTPPSRKKSPVLPPINSSNQSIPEQFILDENTEPSKTFLTQAE